MGTLNYTTAVPVDRTLAECHALLGKHGAAHVATAYQDGAPAGLAFTLPTPHGVRTFTLPVDVDAVHTLLTNQEQAGQFRNLRKKAGTFSSRDQAARVAWRTLKDWLEAQLALIEAGMAAMDQVMLPYLTTGEDEHTGAPRTLYDDYRRHEQLALTGGSDR